MATRVGRGGPALSFEDAGVAVVEDSFSLQQTDRSPSGYTVYKVEFKVRTATPKGHPVLQDCVTWKRFSDFQNLAKQLESIQCSVTIGTKFPYLVKANYFDRFKESVIEERRMSAETLLQFASKNPHLCSSIPLTDFLTGATVERILPHRTGDVTTATVPTNPESPSKSSDSSSDWLSVDPVVGSGNEDEKEVLELTEEDVGTGYIRSDSVMVSEWGLEHTLKLRDEGKPDNTPLMEEEEQQEEESVAKTAPPTRIMIDKVDSEGGELKEGEELPLPSTPVIVSKSSSKTDWWSVTLAEGGSVVDDYDSLIETLESKDNSAFVYKKTLDVHDKGGSRSSSSSPLKDSSEQRRPIPSANGEYILQAGKLITLGLEYESKGDLEEAFDLFKAGVDVLLNGVQADTSTSRREAVRKKTAEYLQYTEVLQNRLQSKKAKGEIKQNSNAKPHLINDFKIISIIAKTVLLVESVHTTQRFVFKVLHKSLTTQEQKSRVQGRMLRSKNRSPTQCPYMVNLLHHYETQSNRIFLLLEHVSGGQLVEHVQSIRHHRHGRKQKKKKGKDVEEGRAMSDRVVIGGEVPPANTKKEDLPCPLVEESPAHPPPDEDDILAKLKSLEPPPSHPVMSSLTSVSSDSDSGANEEDSLTRLARIVKEDAAMMRIQEEKEHEEEELGGDGDSVKVDRLSELRKQLMESFLEDDESPNSGLPDSHPGDEIELVEDNKASGNKDNGEELSDDELTEDQRPQPDGEDFDDEENGEFSELKKHLMAFVSKPVSADDNNAVDQLEDISPDKTLSDFNGKEDIHSSSPINNVLKVNSKEVSTNDSLLLDITGSDDPETLMEPSNTATEIGNCQLNPGSNDFKASQGPPSAASIQVIPPTPTTSSAPIPHTAEQLSVEPDLDHQAIPMKKERKSNSPRKSPEFSPVVSLRSSPDASKCYLSASKEAEIEKNARKWTAQIVKALEHLHANGIVCKDLHPRNILLTSSGDVRLTYFGNWDFVRPTIKNEAIKMLYVAPELLGVEEPGSVSDWWSLGAVLFEILIGKSLVDCHPGGVHSHIPLTIPTSVSAEASSILQGLLQVNPRERLGSGMNGVEDIKSHPFFHSIDWSIL